MINVETRRLDYRKEIRDENSFTSEFIFSGKIDYFNINIGQWEPFIEAIELEIQYDKQNEASII